MPAARHNRSRNAFALLPLLAGLTLPCLAAPETPGTLPAPPVSTAQKSLLLQMQDAFTNIAQTVEPSVVNIKSLRLRPADSTDGDDGSGDTPVPAPTPAPTPKHGTPAPSLPFSRGLPRRSESTGSGVIVRADGYILTNDHVVEGATGGIVTVTLADGREFQGRVFADSKSDLAVVKIDPGATPLPVAGFADSDSVRSGQWAIAVGSPFDLQNTMTVGIISALGRHQSIGNDPTQPPRYYPDLIQTDAAINPGNSGGPLFNIDGKVVGINVAIESPVEGSAGVGFAIPSDIAQEVMNSLIQSGKVTRGYLGLAPDDLTPALQAQYGVKEGAFVRDVRLDSPAGKAGLQAADVVTAFDGRPIKSEVGLRERISATPPGKAVSVAYVRDGRPGALTVTLGTAPALPDDDTPAAPSPVAHAAVSLGLTVRALLPSDRVTLSLAPTTTGVVITAVDPGSPAEAAGLMAGTTRADTILQKIGRKAITSKADYAQAVAALTPGASTTLVLLSVSDNQTHQTALPIRL